MDSLLAVATTFEKLSGKLLHLSLYIDSGRPRFVNIPDIITVRIDLNSGLKRASF